MQKFSLWIFLFSLCSCQARKDESETKGFPAFHYSVKEITSAFKKISWLSFQDLEAYGLGFDLLNDRTEVFKTAENSSLNKQLNSIVSKYLEELTKISKNNAAPADLSISPQFKRIRESYNEFTASSNKQDAILNVESVGVGVGTIEKNDQLFWSILVQLKLLDADDQMILASAVGSEFRTFRMPCDRCIFTAKDSAKGTNPIQSFVESAVRESVTVAIIDALKKMKGQAYDKFNRPLSK